MFSAADALARAFVQGDVVVPAWITARDHPWMLEVIELHYAMVGASRRELDVRLSDYAEPPDSSPWGLRLVAGLLSSDFAAEVDAPVPPREARAAVFAAAADRPTRQDALERAAVRLGADPGELERSVLADVPSERRVTAPDEPISVDALALRANLAIAQALLARSSHVRIRLEGAARALVRHATLRGLICSVSGTGDSTRLEVSGPLSLFRRTTVYGRHLAGLLPLLAWCRDYRLEALCNVRGVDGRLTLDPSAPLPPSTSPRRYDSRLEGRFARDFVRATSEWQLVREPEPVPAGEALIFPDFALVHRADPSRRWWLEILGFWTADYVESKLRRLRAAGLTRLILCIDARRDCGAAEMPASARVIRFDRRVDIRRVLEVVAASPAPETGTK